MEPFWMAFPIEFDAGDGRHWGANLGSGLFNSSVVGSAYLGNVWEGTPKSFDFVVSFQYLVPGTYTPSFTVTKHTTEFDSGPVQDRYLEVNGYYDQKYLPCGFLNPNLCLQTVFVDMTQWIP